MPKLVRTFRQEDEYICEVQNFMGFHIYKKIRRANMHDVLGDIPYEPIGHNTLCLLGYMMGFILLLLLTAAIGTPITRIN